MSQYHEGGLTPHFVGERDYLSSTIENDPSHAWVGPYRGAVVDPPSATDCLAPVEPQLSGYDTTREVSLGHEDGHGEHLRTLNQVQGVMELRLFLPECHSNFRELTELAKAEREIMDRPGGFRAQLRAMADQENCRFSQGGGRSK